MKSASSPLFDAPFAAGQPADGTPLRRRENDSFAAPSYSAEMPLRRRRKRPLNDTEKWIRFSMKAILLSPVVVLVIWSVVLATKSTTTSSNSTNSSNAQVRSHARGNKHHPTNNRKNFPVIAPLGASQNDAAMQQQQYMAPQVIQNNNQMMAAQQQGVVVQPQHLMMSAPQQVITQPQMQQQQQQFMMAPQVYQNSPQQQQQQAVMAPPVVQNPQPMMMIPQSVQNPAAAISQQQAFPQQALPQQQQALSQLQQQDFSPQQLQQQDFSQQQQQQALPQQQAPQILQPPPQQTSQQQAPVRYYYYDASQTQRDAAGNLILPSTVYDSQGRAFPTAQLQASAILEEPPRGVFHHDNYTNNSSIPKMNITYYHPNTIKTPVRDKHRDMALPVATATLPADQSIIVGTVGVMALLVGALSARRLRSRGILQVCLDDVQDEVAYDAAYTTSSQTYGTWKGDLEKFDV